MNRPKCEWTSTPPAAKPPGTSFREAEPLNWVFQVKTLFFD